MKPFLAILLSSTFLIFSFANGQTIKQIKIYAVPWDMKSPLYYNINNIKKHHIYFFQVYEPDIQEMFINYNDCEEKLSSRNEILIGENTNKLGAKVLVELYFDDKKVISIYFDNNGNYYFQKKWHIKNNEIYYLLFKYFSNEIISQQTLENAKNNFKDGFWHNE